jgi:hypothetical protein
MGGEVHRLEPVHERDPAVAEIEQELGGALEGAAVVHVDPGIVTVARRGAAVDDEGQADLLEERDARIARAGGMDDEPVDRALGGELAVDPRLVAVVHDREHHVIAAAEVGLARAGDEVGEDRVHDLVLGGERDHVADRHGAPRGERAGAGVRAVVEAFGRLGHAAARRFGHLRIAVQRPADRGLRKPELPGQLLEVHPASRSKALSISG